MQKVVYILPSFELQFLSDEREVGMKLVFRDCGREQTAFSRMTGMTLS